MRTSALVLFTCAGLLLSGGSILGGSASWTLLRISYYFWTSDLGVELGATSLLVVGALLCLPACWLCTIVPYHPRQLSLMATLMALVTAALVMMSFGLTAMTDLSRAVREPAVVNGSMLRAMSRDALDPAVKSSFATMQMELRCCGVQSYTDWYQHRRTLPAACCGRVWNGKKGDRCDIPLHAQGCLKPALQELRAYINTLSTLGCVIILVLGVTLFTAAYTVVSGVVDREPAPPKPQPFRVACVAQHAAGMAPPAPVFIPPPMPL